MTSSLDASDEEEHDNQQKKIHMQIVYVTRVCFQGKIFENGREKKNKSRFHLNNKNISRRLSKTHKCTSALVVIAL